MNEDPTGYFTMSDVTSSTAIQGILNKIATLNYAKILKNIWQALKIINFALSVTNLIVSVFTGDVVDIALALLNCIVSAIELFNICNLQVVAFVLSKVLAGIGLFKHSYELADAIDKGDMSKILTSVLAIAIDVATLFASCFTGETLVHTEHGYKRIDEIEIGDFVWAYNVETGETELKEVLEVYEKETEELVYVTTDENETINTTSNHPFYVVDKGFVATGDLNVGDVLYKFDGTETIVKKLEIEKLDEAVKVYNLNVFEFHSYFVSDDSVLVHNANYKKNKSDQTKHSLYRGAQGRSTGNVVNDIQKARPKDIIIDTNSGNIGIIGNKQRIHFLSPDAQRLVTTIDDTASNISKKFMSGRFIQASEEIVKLVFDIYKN